MNEHDVSIRENDPDEGCTCTDSVEAIVKHDRSHRWNLRNVSVCLLLALIMLLLVCVGARFMLRAAVVSGDIRRVRLILPFSLDKWAINGTDMYGYGPMQLAAQHGHKEVLALLIENGGDVNLRRPSSRNSPLIMAASRGHVDCCRLLLDKGAKAGEYGLFGGTRHTALQCAAQSGHLDVVDFLLGQGIGPNEEEGTISALHYACKAGHLYVVKRLVAAGADLHSTQEWKHHTPLEFALKHGRTEIAEFLKQAARGSF